MNTKKLFPVSVELGSLALSGYGFAGAAYWYWVFLHSAPVQSISSNSLYLQGVPLSHIIGSLFSIALGGFIHTVHKLIPEVFELFERVGLDVEKDLVKDVEKEAKRT